MNRRNLSLVALASSWLVLALSSGGGNRLVGPGVQVPPGSRVTVIVTMKANAARWAAKFTIK